MPLRKNFAYSTVATAPTPALSGTSLVVATGGGAGFPTAPFPVVVWPAGAQPLSSNAEVAWCSSVSGDTLTLVRAREGSTARSIVVGDQIHYGITKGELDGIDRMEEMPTRYGIWRAIGNSTAVDAVDGIAALTFVGTATARNFATTNWLTRQPRVQYPSVATAGGLTSARFGGGIVSLGNGTLGGFRIKHMWMVSDAAAVAGARQLCGISTATAAPTNVDPAVELNHISVGSAAADTTLKIFYGGSTAQTPINLGANFPANTLGVDVYQVEFINLPQSTATTVIVRRFDVNGALLFTATNVLGPGTAGVTLPATNAALSPIRCWRTNNATALAVSLDYFGFFLDRTPLG